MLSKAEFTILRDVKESKLSNLDSKIVKDLVVKGLLLDNLAITENGLKELKNYRVDNAVILAAGMSTRFVPVSY